MLPGIIQQKLARLIKLADDNGISYLALYGSYSRGEQRPDSDIDLLVDFDKVPGLFEYIDIERKFSAELGIKVDLVTKAGLSKYIRPYIQDDLKVIYVQKS